MHLSGTQHVEHILSTPEIDEGDSQGRDRELRQKVSQLIRMRWVAIGTGILVTYLALGPLNLLRNDVTGPLVALLSALLVFNMSALVVLRTGGMELRKQLLLQVLGDVLILTGLLHFSGGIENPFVFLYLIHVILAAILFEPWMAYGVSFGTLVLVTTLSLTEYAGVIPHHDLLIYQHGSDVDPGRNLFFVGGILMTLTLLIGLITYFSTALMRQLRESRSKAIEHARTVSRAKRRFETVLKASGAGVLLFGPELNLIWANDRIKEWFPNVDFSPGEPCPHLHENQCTLYSSGRSDFSSTSAENDPDHCQRCSALTTIERGSPSEREQVYVSPDGNKRHFQFITNPIRNENGEVEQIVELVHDVTDRKRMEEQIEHQERMSSLGRLASGIMHEIGNPLSSISARLRRLKQKTEEEFTLETVEFLETQISRLNRLIRDISSFAQAPEPNWTSCRADHIIDEITTLLELDQNSDNVDIETNIDDFSSFLASEDQLSQVFLNLGLNALEAMPDGGTLTISAWREDGEVHFSFRDTGTGIPPEEQSDIFTPYYSSGKREDGTGLGLSIVHSFVEAHGGDIGVNSVPGEGSTFTVSIPYHDPSSRQSERSQTTKT